MRFPVVLAPWILNFSATMVQYTGFKKIQNYFEENINS